MKRTILRNIFISVGALFAVAQLVFGDSTSKGLAGVGNALPATVIVVTNTNDSGPGSLRDALAAASDGDTIDATGVSGTILLTSGELQINHNVTITNGSPTDAEGGGGILNHGGLILSGTSILSNTTRSCGAFCIGAGGGINSNSGGALTVTNSIISDNSAGALSRGAGMYLVGGGIATITDSTISGNTGALLGGGISSSLHMLTVTNSTISDNSAGAGGGININSGGMLTVTNSTISGNTANGLGGGIIIISGGMLTVTNSTISGNSTPARGGAVCNLGAATIGDTILNASASGGTIVNAGTFTFTSLGYNLASDNGGGVLTGPGDQINTNPMLGPLQDNGGPTFTHALLPGSPA